LAIEKFGHHTLWWANCFSSATRYGDLIFLIITWFRATETSFISVAHKPTLGSLKVFLT
jgi:hypothetical protein